MKSMFVLAASAMVLMTTTSAFAAEQHVKVRGRTDAAIHADIVAAANSVCREELGIHAGDLMIFCVQDVTYDAIKRVGSPALTAYSKAQRRTLLVKASY
ncbi:hypothetical protein [Caulobacter sp. DWR2-3-1b2]|uniref:hypothetical protein n=1 Tax=unclassified Caulobacter TaxID=2648921 RepID=UPI003CEF3DAF